MVRQLTLHPVAPSIETAEAEWAAGELVALIRRVGTDSVAGMVLRQAQQELVSLVRCAAADEPGTVLGPVRLSAAA